jgi:Arc/MetJ-type ribon-helix-helix transcriptional regulator
MSQAKFTLEQSHIDFLEQFKERGFKDKSEIVRLALDRLARELKREELVRSADLYAELYEEDLELQQLTEAARVGLPQ